MLTLFLLFIVLNNLCYFYHNKVFWNFQKSFSTKLENVPKDCFGHLWIIYQGPFLWFFYGISMIFLWYFYGISMVFLWYFYGNSMVFLWYFYDIAMVFLWYFYDISMYFYDISMLFIWYFYCIYMIFLWYFYNISMVLLWYFYDISIVLNPILNLGFCLAVIYTRIFQNQVSKTCQQLNLR